MQRLLVSGFLNDGKRVLLLKRGEAGFLANHWELPGGKVEVGEDPVCAVVREMKEEAGIDCKVVRPYFTWHVTNEYKGASVHFVEIDFFMKAKKGQKITPADGMVDYAWVAEGELDNYLISEHMLAAIREGFKLVKQ